MAVLFTLIILLLSACIAYAQGGTNATATPTATAEPGGSPTPNATASPTPVPSPAPRQVFSSPTWDVDHETIAVNNNGAQINVIAWINDPTNNLKYEVDAGAIKTVLTPSILVQSGQIVNAGFEAYENQTLIDSKNFTFTVNVGPTPTSLPPESVTVSGVVIDADNSSPVVGATVTFDSLTYEKTYPPATTGSDGSFTSPKMYPDVYKITVSASGYQTDMRTTGSKITSDSTIGNIGLEKVAGAATPTPSPTPESIIDSWISLLYSPTLCFGTLSAIVAVIAGSIGIYEWLARQRAARLKKEKEEAGKAGENKDQPAAGAPGIKKL